MLAGAHKKLKRARHTEMYLLGLKVQYKHKFKFPLDMVSKHVFLYLQLSDYDSSVSALYADGTDLTASGAAANKIQDILEIELNVAFS